MSTSGRIIDGGGLNLDEGKELSAQRERHKRIRQGPEPEAAVEQEADPQPEVEIPSADVILGKVMRARSDERKLEILEEHNIDVGTGWETFEEMEEAVQRVTDKAQKQANITEAASVNVAGSPPTVGDDYESLIAQLQAEMAKPMTPASMKRRAAISAKLNQL